MTARGSAEFPLYDNNDDSSKNVPDDAYLGRVRQPVQRYLDYKGESYLSARRAICSDLEPRLQEALSRIKNIASGGPPSHLHPTLKSIAFLIAEFEKAE